jgi:hypothetical protein
VCSVTTPSGTQLGHPADLVTADVPLPWGQASDNLSYPEDPKRKGTK